MLEMHLRQPGFIYSACRTLIGNKERIQKFKETGNSGYINQNELNKTCFQLDMAYGDFKHLTRRTAPDNVLRDEAFIVAKIPKYDGYQCRITSVVYKFFNEKISAGVIKNETMSNRELAEELHKPIIRKFEKRKHTHNL